MIALILLNAFFGLHPFYVSMTDINYNESGKSLEVSVRIFTDDFEGALKKTYQMKVDLINPVNKVKAESMVNEYVNKRLQLYVDGKPCSASFVGYEQQSESTWAYFEIKNVPRFKKLTVRNSLLYDYQNQQINMLHVKAFNKEQSIKLDYPKTEWNFGW